MSVSHEARGGGIAGNLGPTDGFTSLGVGASYQMDNIRISGGVQYRWIGNAKTEINNATNRFRNNRAVSAGIRVGFSF